MQNTAALIEVRNVAKTFAAEGKGTLTVLEDINIVIQPGEIVVPPRVRGGR